MATQLQSEPKTAPAGSYSGFDKQYINGSWRLGRRGASVKDTNPYTGKTLLEIPAADENDVDEAYKSAAKAQPGWASRVPADRADVMLKVAHIMEVRRDEIVNWLIQESGSTRLKSELEWQTSHGIMREAASAAHRAKGHIIPSDVPGKESRVYRKPVGVVGMISPWNWPLHLSLRSVGPALAVGNGVAIKPASDTPVTGGLLIAKLFEEAGLPPGLLNVVIGTGEAIGNAFVQHPIPRVISFTGSTAVGRNIARLAADASIMKRLELELGGNTPFVVLEDANVEYAVEAGLFGRFLHQGQICMSANRLIVDDTIYDHFVERFADRVRRMKYGDPDKNDTVVGPIINKKQLDHLLQHVNQARESGLRELVGGDPEGLVLPPHVFVDVPNANPLARDELFGPVAPIIRAHGEDDALEIANDTEYGLSSAVVTRDAERGVRFATRIEAGMAHVNDQPVNDLPNCPFGGEKNSGIGRFGGD